MCPGCGQRSGSAALSELGHIEYAEAQLDGWYRRQLLSSEIIDGLRRALLSRRSEVEQTLAGPRAPAVSAPPVALPAPARRLEQRVSSALPYPPPEASVPSSWIDPSPAAAAPPAAARPVPAPARPTGPTSAERFVRGVVPFLSRYSLVSLPYLGVLLLVGALGIGLYQRWSAIPGLAQLGIFVAATLVSFGMAYWLRARVQLPVIAGAVSLLGGAFMGAAGFALSGDQLMNTSDSARWLVISVFVMAGYGLVATVQRDRPFGFLTVGAVASTLLATFSVAGVEPQWQAGALTLFLAATAFGSPRVARALPNIAFGMWWSSRIAMPVVVVGMLVWKYGWVVFPFMTVRASDYATGLVLWGASATYYTDWYQRRRPSIEYVAALCITVSYALTAYLFTPTVAWIGPSLLVVTVGYVLYGRYLRPQLTAHRSSADEPAVSTRIDTVLARVPPAYLVGYALVVVAIVWPFQTAETRAWTLAVAAMIWAASVVLFPRWAGLHEHLAVWTTLAALVAVPVERSAWQSLVVAALGALAFVYDARVRSRLLDPRLEGVGMFAGADRALRQISPALLAGHGLLLVAVAWPWQSTDSRIVTLLSVAVIAVLALRLYPRRYRLYEATATVALTAGLVQTLLILEERTALDADWRNLGFVLFSSGLIALAARRGRVLQWLDVDELPGESWWFSPPALAGLLLGLVAYEAALLFPGSEATGGSAGPAATLGSIATLCALTAESGVTAVLNRRWLAHYVTAVVFLTAFSEGLALRAIPYGQSAGWLLLPMLVLAVVGESVQAYRVRHGDQVARDETPWQSAVAATRTPYLAAAYLLSLGIVLLASQQLRAGAGARVDLMFAYAGVTALWLASAALRRSSLLAVAAAPLAVVPFVMAFDHDFFTGHALRGVDLAWCLALLGAAYLAIGRALDRTRGTYGDGFHLVAALLMAAAVIWAAPDRAITVWVQSIALLFTLVSALLVRRGQHPRFQRLVDRLFPLRDGVLNRAARSGFVYLAAAQLPVLMLLALGLVVRDPGASGLALALLAAAYLAMVPAARRWWRDAQPALAAGTFALAVVGPLAAATNPLARLLALALTTAVFAAHAPMYRNPRYLYVALGLLPILIGLLYQRAGVGFAWYGLGLVLVGGLSGAAGEALHVWRLGRGDVRLGWRWSYSEPFLVSAPVAVALGLAMAAGQAHGFVIAAFLVAAAVFLAAVLRYREPLFLYGVNVLVAIAYGVAAHALGMEGPRFGLAMLPWVAAMAQLSRPFAAPVGEGPDARLQWMSRWEAALLMPAVVAAWVLPLIAREDRSLLAVTLGAAALLHAYGAWRFRSAHWLHPVLWFGLAAASAGLFAFDPRLTWARLAADLIVVVSLAQFAAIELERRGGFSALPGPRLRAWTGTVVIVPLTGWALPPQVFAAVAGVAALLLTAAGAHVEGALVAAVLAATYTVAATLWRRQPFTWIALALAVIAVGHVLTAAAATLAVGFAVTALLAVLFALLASALTVWSATAGREHVPEAAALWRRPLAAGAIAVGGGALLGSTLTLATLGFARAEWQPFIATLAACGFGGAVLAWSHRRVDVVYLSIAAMLGACFLEMALFEVRQPLFYTVPAGSYLLAIGLVERARGDRQLGFPLEVSGLVLLLGTTLLQASGWQPVGIGRFGYGAALLAESLGVLFIGLWLRHRLPFFAAVGGAVAAMAFLLVDPLRSVWVTNFWIIIALVGAAMLVAGGLVERRRQQLLRTARSWLDLLDAWD